MKMRMLMLVLSAGLVTGIVQAQTAVSQDRSDEEMKLMAINGLREAEPSVAVPQLEKVLAGNSSIELKRKALAVLAEMDSAAAREELGRIARGQAAPGLQVEAIRRLGNEGGADNLKILSEIYDSTSDTAIKRQILSAFRNADDSARLLNAAKNEKSAELRGEAIRNLGQTDDTQGLEQLYQTETDPAIKAQIIHAFGQSDNSRAIGQIAKTDASPEMRRLAIHQLGTMDADASGKALQEIYGTEKDSTVRREILHSLATQDNAKVLVELAKKETNVDLKKYAVEQLSHMDSKEATDYLMSLLNQ
ncbi:MAG TPA: HEAT repeat domain-containing protein [Candidatus Acidoferrales bacterium]|nr:HEAT repeat domain-containing protein [Candidatus Acidoferrales bacterium]